MYKKIDNHIKQVRLEDPTFKPFLTGLMSVERNMLVNFRIAGVRDNESVAYFYWRDPDGRFKSIANLYNVNNEMGKMNAYLDKRVAEAKEKAEYEKVTIDVSGLLLPIPNGFGTCHPRREYPEDVVAMLAKLRSDRRKYLDKCEEVEATLIRVIKENNLLEGSDVHRS